MHSTPLVSIICLCFNQKKYVSEAIRSVLSQTYKNIELIVVDDGSTDGSQEEIKKTIGGTEIVFLELPQNLGNCAAFNIGFKKSKGQFIIDLAADDMLLPPRIELGVNDFSNASEKTGVHFSDAFLTDEKGNIVSTHYRRDKNGQLVEEIPKGNVYSHLIKKYFISPPSMMVKREVLEELGGYDENLAYEDFDFWIRSSRDHKYIFNSAPLVKKRNIADSHASGQREILNKHQKSTYLVCEKIFNLNKKPDEFLDLIIRCKYEIKQCLITMNFHLIPNYVRLISNSRAAYLRLSSPSSIEI